MTKNRYPRPGGRDENPTDRDARWSLGRSTPFNPRQHPILKSVLVVGLGVGAIWLASLVLAGTALGLVGLLIMIVVLGVLRF